MDTHRQNRNMKSKLNNCGKTGGFVRTQDRARVNSKRNHKQMPGSVGPLDGTRLAQALVRVEGLRQGIPRGFETPVAGNQTIAVHEIQLSSCSFDTAVNEVAHIVKRLRTALSLTKFPREARTCLHLQVTGSISNGYLFVRLPSSFLNLLHSMKMALEIVCFNE